MPLTQALGTFIADLSRKGAPTDAADVARTGFIDYVGVMVAGRAEASPRILREVLKPGPGDATLYLSGERRAAPEVAVINGAAAHALDYDDQGLNGHPSTVLVSAILPEGETLDISGAALLTAYVAGYETWAELIRREQDLHHGKGWHPTGIFGTVAAAAACASLRGLDAEKTTHALGIAASQAAGLTANFGTLTKPFHAGRSAQSGLLAARLAEAGFTASPDIFEHPQGLLNAISPAGRVDLKSEPEGLGNQWRIVTGGLNIKKYPSCYCAHRIIDAMLDLMSEHPLVGEVIEKVTVSISENFATILRNHQPQTGLSAKFSVEFAVAAAVLAGGAGLSEFSDDFAKRPDVQALMKRVAIETNTDYDPDDLGASYSDHATVTLRSGKVLETCKVTHPHGHWKQPFTSEELYGKFRACFAAGGIEDAAERIFDRLTKISAIPARELLQL